MPNAYCLLPMTYIVHMYSVYIYMGVERSWEIVEDTRVGVPSIACPSGLTVLPTQDLSILPVSPELPILASPDGGAVKKSCQTMQWLSDGINSKGNIIDV